MEKVGNGNVSDGFLQYNKHLFVHIGHANHSYSDPLLESVDIRQIYDKFPEKKGGLKELFGKGPQNAFFLVKFWVSRPCFPVPMRRCSVAGRGPTLTGWVCPGLAHVVTHRWLESECKT